MVDVTGSRPKAGDRVVIYGTVTYFPRNDNGDECALVKIDNCPNASRTFGVNEIFPLPAPPAPRQPWEKVRDAVDALKAAGYHSAHYESLPGIADMMEAAAAPKPPTLAEAVRAYLECPSPLAAARKAMAEALARAEKGA